MKKALFFLILAVMAVSAAAQSHATLSDRAYKAAYKKAVQLYANQQFDEAVKEFLPLTLSKYDNPMVPFAHYYLALSANNRLAFSQARLSLRQLLERFPTWKHIDEAHYLYAEAFFGDKYYEQAFEQLGKITTPSMQKDMDNMAAKYVFEIKDIKTLQQLNNRFPAERSIAEAIINLVQTKPSPTREELRLSDELTNRYKIGRQPQQEFKNDANANSIDIGVLLPFDLRNYTNDMRSSNQYVYDMYIGMKMGVDQLREEGYNANLFAFEVGKDENDFQRLTSDRSMAGIDLFVGPLFVQANQAVVDFSYKHKIYQVHPLSNNSELLRGEGVLLLNPSYRDFAHQALDDISLTTSKKTVSIYFGRTKKDSTAAFRYAEVAENRGFKVLQISRYYQQNSINSSNSNGHIYLSCEPEELNGMLSAVRKQKQNCPVYITGASMNIDKVSKDLLKNNVYILYPEFIDPTKEEVSYFRAKYINQYGIVPSYFSHVGFDMATFFGRMLKDGKSNFRSNLNLIEYTQGYLLSGYDFTGNNNSNKLIPIVQMTDEGLRKIVR